MAGVWKKTLNYLGLVEEDEDFVDEMPEADTAPVRRMRPQAVREVPAEAEGVVRTIASPRPAVAATGAIHKSEPKRFNEARDLGDKFREGIPVIMNLQGTDDSIAHRLVDFASGLVFGLGGKIEMAANRVYLLTPADVEVSAEEARPWFRQLRAVRDRVREKHPDVVDLSMGMSLDYQAAVEEGATMVRIGTALFGPRTP